MYYTGFHPTHLALLTVASNLMPMAWWTLQTQVYQCYVRQLSSMAARYSQRPTPQMSYLSSQGRAN
jgi:hypothetical protein